MNDTRNEEMGKEGDFYIDQPIVTTHKEEPPMNVSSPEPAS